ncbi:MAG: DUF4349 domain-containing protein [Patescibacteria group bacterium]|jgi:hypothetical protein
MKISKPTFYWLLGLGAVLIVALGLTIFWGRPVPYTTSSGGMGGVYFSDEFAVKTMNSEVAPEAAYLSSDASIDTSGATQLIIKTGDLSITTSNVETTADAIAGVAKEHGGLVTNRSISNYPDMPKSGWMSIQVEATAFDAAMGSIKDLASVIESENVYASDVTESVINLQARLSNAQAEEAQYLLIMNQATEVEDMLMIENALSNVRAEIEMMEAEMNYYEESVSLSTINIYLSEETTIGFETDTFRPWQSIIEAVQTVVQLFQDFIVALIYTIIVGGAIGIPAAALFILGRAIYRKVRK